MMDNKLIKNLLVKDAFGENHSLTPQRPQLGVEVSWGTNEKTIKMAVAEPNKNALVACVNHSYEVVVVIYSNLIGFALSHGAIIFNHDGGIRKQIELPELISDEYKTYKKKVGLNKAQMDIRFLNCFFKKDTLDEKLIFWIRFHSDFYEIREVNKVTGEFGQCLGISRQ